VQSPPSIRGALGEVTNASLTLPNGTTTDLTNQVGNFALYAAPTNEAALETLYPPGSYTIRFGQNGEGQHVVPMTMPATPASIPAIANYLEAQAIDPAQSFTLRWNEFTPQQPGAFINLIISDQFGNLIFRAPNFCVPRALAASDTSVVIPANYFKPGLTYNGLIQFGVSFYSSTNDIPRMAGYGAVSRTTTFMLKATGGGGGGTGEILPANFLGSRLLQNRHPEMSLSGSAGKSYRIRRSASVANPNWLVVGTVTMSDAGSAVFEDADNSLQLPAFYQAMSVDTPGPGK
jgi:hypothetical protein